VLVVAVMLVVTVVVCKGQGSGDGGGSDFFLKLHCWDLGNNNYFNGI
jgi:hypothetical protein